MNPPRLVLVEQVRGLAALAVAWFHLTNTYAHWGAATGQYGWLGLEVFFVISGLVIPMSVLHVRTSAAEHWRATFLARRLVRIEPPYLVSVAVVIALNWASSLAPGFQGKPSDVSLTQVLLHALYLIPLTDYVWLQPVYWTLAYEFCFYLTVPLVFGALVSPSKWPFVALLCVVAALISLAGVSPIVALFAVGCAVFRRHLGVDDFRSTVWLVALALGPMVWREAYLQAAAGAATALLLVSRACSNGVRGTVGGWLTALGTLSYSLYLLHVPIGGRVVNLGKRWLDSPVQQVMLSLLALAVSFVAAYLFWRWVEKPCIAAARRLSLSRGNPAPAL